jgi:hypothetical protein
LFDNRFRHYDPTRGGYIQSDAAGLGAGVNTYAYAGGNPLSYVDPDGDFFFVPALIGGGIGALSDLGLQLLLNGGRLKCVSWAQVGLAGAAGAVGGAWASGAFRHSVSGKSWFDASHRWGSVRARYGRAQGLAPGQDVHHWLIPQSSSVARNFPAIANHPLNLNPTIPAAVNRGRFNTLSSMQRTLEGSPGWARAAAGYGTAGVAAEVVNDCTCD